MFNTLENGWMIGIDPNSDKGYLRSLQEHLLIPPKSGWQYPHVGIYGKTWEYDNETTISG